MGWFSNAVDYLTGEGERKAEAARQKEQREKKEREERQRAYEENERRKAVLRRAAERIQIEEQKRKDEKEMFERRKKLDEEVNKANAQLLVKKHEAEIALQKKKAEEREREEAMKKKLEEENMRIRVENENEKKRLFAQNQKRIAELTAETNATSFEKSAEISKQGNILVQVEKTRQKENKENFYRVMDTLRTNMENVQHAQNEELQWAQEKQNEREEAHERELQGRMNNLKSVNSILNASFMDRKTKAMNDRLKLVHSSFSLLSNEFVKFNKELDYLDAKSNNEKILPEDFVRAAKIVKKTVECHQQLRREAANTQTEISRNVAFTDNQKLALKEELQKLRKFEFESALNLVRADLEHENLPKGDEVMAVRSEFERLQVICIMLPIFRADALSNVLDNSSTFAISA